MKKSVVIILLFLLILPSCTAPDVGYGGGEANDLEIGDTRGDESGSTATHPHETLPFETFSPESPPSETTPSQPNKNIVYTAEYYSGSYNGYDFIDYEDEMQGEAYKKAYPNKYFNDNVTIELEITAELEQTVFSVGDRFWISFKATNVGEPFMFIDWEVNYFDSWLVSTEYVTEDGINCEFYNDYYVDGRPSLDAGPFEDLFETGETRVDRNPYTVTEDIPLGKYDLYIYFHGYTFVVRDVIFIAY